MTKFNSVTDIDDMKTQVKEVINCTIKCDKNRKIEKVILEGEDVTEDFFKMYPNSQSGCTVVGEVHTEKSARNCGHLTTHNNNKDEETKEI